MASAQEELPGSCEKGGRTTRPWKIRPAVPRDLPAIEEIEFESFSNPWQADTFRSLLGQDRATVLVAEDPEVGVIGYAVFWWVMDQAELGNLAVRDGFQNRGTGSALLDQAKAHARAHGAESLFLEVRVSNASARRLYANHGFSQISVRKDYYRSPREDALILVSKL